MAAGLPLEDIPTTESSPVMSTVRCSIKPKLQMAIRGQIPQ
jgi:hypothetical protein